MKYTALVLSSCRMRKAESLPLEDTTHITDKEMASMYCKSNNIIKASKSYDSNAGTIPKTGANFSDEKF
jgi:hypothetical protein